MNSDMPDSEGMPSDAGGVDAIASARRAGAGLRRCRRIR